MDYRTVFDIADAGYKTWHSAASGLIFVAIGVALVFFPHRLPPPFSKTTRYHRMFSWFWLGLSVAFTAFDFASSYGRYRSLTNATRQSMVEGVVSQFHPMPAAGHDMERFCVGDKCFAYSDYIITGGFNQTSSHGGPIRDGLPVRVTFVGNAIVKLEVAKQ